MKCNTEKILFEGVVMDARETLTTDPPSEIIDINYKVDPYNVVENSFNEITGDVDERYLYTENNGWVQICLPVFNGLKPGDKIQVIKV
jgi:hypothetical protein